MPPRASSPPPRRNNRWLLTAGYASRTVASYRRAAAAFFRWAAHRDLTSSVTSVGPLLDEAFADYLHWLHHRGAGKAAAVAAFYGLNMRLPGSKRAMPVSRQALAGFVRTRPSVPYPPLSWGVTCVVAVWMVRRGYFRQGVAMLLAFDCLLRAGELWRLRREDVVAGGDARVGAEYAGMFLRLAHTKTGADQSVDVLDRSVQQLLLVLVRFTRPRSRLFPFTSASLLSLLHLACRDLGLDDAFVLHSARHGGATRLWLQRWSLESIMLRGRWRSAESAKRYVQAGRARLAAVAVPAAVARMAAAFSASLLRAVLLALAQDTGVGAGTDPNTCTSALHPSDSGYISSLAPTVERRRQR